MKNRSSFSKLIPLSLASLALGLLALPAPLPAQVSWDRQAYGQLHYIPGHEGDPAFAYNYPNNNNWSQSLTLSDPARPPVYEIAPSNWSTDTYPTGGGDVTLGNGGLGSNNAPTNLDRFVMTGNTIGAIVLNSLTIQQDGGLNIEAGATLTANLFNFQGNNNNDATLTNIGGGGAFPVIFLSAGGTLKKTTGTSTFTIDPNVGLRVNNGGTIACDAGALQLPSSGSTYAGGVNFNAATGALIDLAPANAVDSNVVLFTGPMTGINTGGTVRLNKGWIRAGTGGSTLNFGGPTFQFQGGRLVGTAADPFTNAGTINITDAATLTGVGGFINNGSIIQSDAGTLEIYRGDLTNRAGAVYDIRNDLGITNPFSSFANSGTLRKSAGIGTSTIEDHFDNAGTVAVNSGTLQFTQFHQTAGVLDLNGGNLSSNVDIVIDGGLLVGSGTITGNVINNGGIVGPGHSPGIIAVNGNYTQGATGTLNIEIGGATAGTGYDQLQVSGTAALGGTLNLSLINGFRPAVGDVFPFILPSAFTGSFSTINTTGFTGQVNYSAGAITITVLTVAGTPTPTPTPIPSLGTLGDISTRLPVGTGANVMIAGFIVQGSSPKRVLIRAAGPSLAQFGVPNALANPQLELHDTANTIGMNDNWQTTQIGGIITSDQVTEIQNSGLAPRDPAESALIAILPPGSYTAIVQGVSGGTGVGIVEAYDLDATSGSLLANIATRGFVQTGDNAMIGGFIVVTQPTRVIIRAIGPSLTQFGVPDALANPQLELHDATSTIAQNNDWQTTQIGGIITSDQVAEIQNSQLAPTNPAESAIVATLQPGSYTAIVRGVNNTTGNALVEVYRLP